MSVMTSAKPPRRIPGDQEWGVTGVGGPRCILGHGTEVGGPCELPAMADNRITAAGMGGSKGGNSIQFWTPCPWRGQGGGGGSKTFLVLGAF